MSQLKPTKNHGFTLLEILLVIGIIAVLAGIVIVAINPSRQLAQVRNTQRKLNINEIDKALKQYYIDNHSYPDTISTTLTEICDTGSETTGHSITCTGLADLSFLVPTYLTAIPTDPQATSTTGYMVMKNSNNKIILYSSEAELNTDIGIGGSAIPTDGLVSYWSFDGNANDSVGTNHGTLYGDTQLTTGVKGLPNTAYAFDGNGDYVSQDYEISNLDKFSISVWAKTRNAEGTRLIAAEGGGINHNIIRFPPTGSTEITIGGVTKNINYGCSSSLDAWNFYTLSYSGTHIVAYCNSIQGGISEASGLVGDSSQALFIGARNLNGAPSIFFNGSIDSVRIYNRALTADEINNIYQVEKP